MNRCPQLTLEQRSQIYVLKKAGLSQTRIAGFLVVNKLTISRGLKCNCSGVAIDQGKITCGSNRGTERNHVYWHRC